MKERALHLQLWSVVKPYSGVRGGRTDSIQTSCYRCNITNCCACTGDRVRDIEGGMIIKAYKTYCGVIPNEVGLGLTSSARATGGIQGIVEYSVAAMSWR